MSPLVSRHRVTGQGRAGGESAVTQQPDRAGPARGGESAVTRQPGRAGPVVSQRSPGARAAPAGPRRTHYDWCRVARAAP